MTLNWTFPTWSTTRQTAGGDDGDACVGVSKQQWQHRAEAAKPCLDSLGTRHHPAAWHPCVNGWKSGDGC